MHPKGNVDLPENRVGSRGLLDEEKSAARASRVPSGLNRMCTRQRPQLVIAAPFASRLSRTTRLR
jgi:hypothetical protein